jgi:GH24 family phage-related lysozyme (muramidase)
LITKAAIDLILAAEGVDQPFAWPGGGSGITIGYGYDLGFEQYFAKDWAGLLLPAQITRLSAALGITGQAARQIAHRFDDIKISRNSALQVFVAHTIPQEEAKTLAAFPGLEKLPPPVRGALVSLVFNRGAGMADDSHRPAEQTRLEMRAIRDAVATGDLKRIAGNLRAMKRLWVGKGLNGLLDRREAEAALVESAIAS